MPLRPLLLAALVASSALPAAAQGNVVPVNSGSYQSLMDQRAADATEREAQRIANNIPQCVGNFYRTYCHYPDGTVEIGHIDHSASAISEAGGHVPYMQGRYVQH